MWATYFIVGACVLHLLSEASTRGGTHNHHHPQSVSPTFWCMDVSKMVLISHQQFSQHHFYGKGPMQRYRWPLKACLQIVPLFSPLPTLGQVKFGPNDHLTYCSLRRCSVNLWDMWGSYDRHVYPWLKKVYSCYKSLKKCLKLPMTHSLFLTWILILHPIK